SVRLVAHAVEELSALAYLLQREQIAAFVVHAGEAVADELLRDVREPVAVAAPGLVGGPAAPGADPAEHGPRAIGDAAVRVAQLVAVEGAAGRILGLLRDARELQRLAVVERGVAAAMLHDDGMILRGLV